MLRAASNGFLVVSTSFATDVISGIDAIFQMVGDEYASSLAESLRVVLYQHLVDGRLTAEMLMSESSASRVATIIRSGRVNLAQLKNELQMQRNQQLLSASTAQPAARQPMGVRTA
jgi:twitching motility protein PilT